MVQRACRDGLCQAANFFSMVPSPAPSGSHIIGLRHLTCLCIPAVQTCLSAHMVISTHRDICRGTAVDVCQWMRYADVLKALLLTQASYVEAVRSIFPAGDNSEASQFYRSGSSPQGFVQLLPFGCGCSSIRFHCQLQLCALKSNVQSLEWHVRGHGQVRQHMHFLKSSIVV